MSMCSAPLRELSNPGASGSIFYLTDDDEFIIKTVQHKEGEFLQKLLPGYYMNLNQNPRTLLPKFFGLYCFQCNSKNVRLIVMNNLLPSYVKLHLKYDLKGSTYNRKVRTEMNDTYFPQFNISDRIPKICRQTNKSVANHRQRIKIWILWSNIQMAYSLRPTHTMHW